MEKITLTEKRFFEWHEDDKSVTLRNKSGSYGGGSEVLIIDYLGVESKPRTDNNERNMPNLERINGNGGRLHTNDSNRGK